MQSPPSLGNMQYSRVDVTIQSLVTHTLIDNYFHHFLVLSYTHVQAYP